MYKNLEELKEAMEQDPKQEKLDWANLPVFGGEEIKSTTIAVWSWDPKRVLVTDFIGGLVILDRVRKDYRHGVKDRLTGDVVYVSRPGAHIETYRRAEETARRLGCGERFTVIEIKEGTK